MSDADSGKLTGRRILVVEDEFYLAQDLCQALMDEGADIAGPANTVRKAQDLVEQERVDLAVLDINIKGEMIFPLAAELRQRNVPFVFTTGYDEIMIPPEYQSVERWEKPLVTARLMQSLMRL